MLSPLVRGILCCFVLLSPVVNASQIITLNTSGEPPLNTRQMTGFMDLVAQEAFKRINIELNTIHLPAERGLKNVNAGIDDGEMSRVFGMEKSYPNLIRVPEKIMDWEFVAFSPRNISLENGWQSLAPYSLAYVNGWKILEKNADFPNVSKVRNVKQLFTLLKRKRADLVLYERWSGLFAKKKLGLNNVKMLQPPLTVKAMYIYLHKKHRSLVKPLSRALADIKKDGTYLRFFNQTLGEFDH